LSESEGEDKGVTGGLDPKIKPPKSPPRKRSETFAIKEVLHQLGNLSCNMQKLTEETKTLSVNQSRQQTEFQSFRNQYNLESRRPLTGTHMNLPHATPIIPVIPPVVADMLPNVPAPAYQQAQQALVAAVPDAPGHNSNLDLPVALHNGARISKKTYLSARTGEFVHLPEFAPNTEPSGIMESILDESTGQVVFKQKSIKKALDSYLAWSRAWAGYEALLMSILPALYLNLTDYRLFVQNCDALYHWSAVSAYDQRHRHRLSLTHSLDFQTCSTDIYICTLNASTIRPNPKACYVCGSIDHNMKDCPFSKQQPKPNTQKRNQPYQPNQPKLMSNFTPRSDAQAYGEGRQVVCFNWNQGRCNSVVCWCTHVCSGCGGVEPRISCSRCNTTKG
jgi:hypothetical protein